MTDDEAFIRAVVDHPGDDTPRLAYADWLDDRDDPARAAYLRAERAAVATGDAAGLRDLAAGLDPVWVARVSRPPVGVCAPGLRYDCNGLTPGPPLTPADLDAFEAEHGCRLPAAYRAFLLNQNGGYPYPSELPHPADPDDDPVRIDSFYMLPPADWEEDDAARVPDPLDGPGDGGGLGRVLWIATDGNCGGLFLGLDGPAAGRVYWNTDVVHGEAEGGDFHPVADALPEVLGRFLTTDPDWVQFIVRDEPDNLRAWLDAGGSVTEAAPDNDEWRPLEHAVQWDRPALVRLLLDRGAPVTEIAWEVANRLDDAAIRAMIRAASPTKPQRPKKGKKGR